MTAATALVAGNDPLPELAARAVEQALDRAALSHAAGIFLLLTPEFGRSAAAAVHAASRAGSCLQVAGGIVAGVANERSWVLDRPAAAVLVLGEPHGLGNAEAGADNLVCLAAEASLPEAWRDGTPRCGLLFQDPLIKPPGTVWQHGRIAADHRACVNVVGARRCSAVSTGLRGIGPARCVESTSGFEVVRIDGLRAADALRRELPAEHRGLAGTPGPALPLHHLCAMLGDEATDGLPRLLPILGANADGSLTLGDRVSAGEMLRFGIRQPLDAERDMRLRLAELAETCREPTFGFFFSCIGRGPYFYDGEDRDWQLLRECFPSLPFLGAYGSGQIASVPGTRALQNCVVVDLFCR